MPGSTFRSAVRRALTFWRRSIQARVVVSTVVLSAVVVSGVGWLLLQQTQRGLLQHRVDAVLAEVNTVMADANEQLEGSNSTINNNAVFQRDTLVEQLIERGSSRGFSVISPQSVGSTARFDEGAILTEGLDPSSVPQSLRQHFGEVADTAWTYTRISMAEHASGPGIVVGSQIQLPADGAYYTLYFLFPLDEQQETLALVTRALVTAAALLVLLVAALTWVVTRQVVTPVRMARRVAERLAAGQLQERVRVTGEDDLARLATSFNQMASSLQRQIRQLEELSRVQQQFVSDVSHELRTPLTTVRMASDVLHDARRCGSALECRGGSCRRSRSATACPPTCSPTSPSWSSPTSTFGPRPAVAGHTNETETTGPGPAAAARAHRRTSCSTEAPAEEGGRRPLRSAGWTPPTHAHCRARARVAGPPGPRPWSRQSTIPGHRGVPGPGRGLRCSWCPTHTPGGVRRCSAPSATASSIAGPAVPWLEVRPVGGPARTACPVTSGMKPNTEAGAAPGWSCMRTSPRSPTSARASLAPLEGLRPGHRRQARRHPPRLDPAPGPPRGHRRRPVRAPADRAIPHGPASATSTATSWTTPTPSWPLLPYFYPSPSARRSAGSGRRQSPCHAGLPA